MKVWSGWLCAALVMCLVLAGCGSSNSSNVTITISPSSATVLLGTSVQFIPNVAGSSNAVTWSVNGIANGDATFGTISSTGLYTAPVTRPIAASGAAVPIIFAIANATIPNSGTSGAVIELSGGSNLANFAPGNTVTISGNSVAGWNGSFIILAAGTLQNGNFGIQIPNPAGPPANGVGGTATATPNISITAQVQSTNAIASATVSLDSGVRVSFSQPTCTIGTSETFLFAPLVGVSGTSNVAVTWSRSGVGSIDPNGLYTATAPGTATVTATSVADPSESASATITVVDITNTPPTLASITPTTGALGAASQNVYLSGANFICTTGVFVNINNSATSIPLPPGSLSSLSSTTFLVSVPDSILSTQPASGSSTATLGFTAAREGVIPTPCSASSCQLVLSPVRPALVASTPDSVSLPSSGTFNVTLDGGYFGAGIQGNPMVSVRLNGQTISSACVSPFTTNCSDRQLILPISASNVSGGPGLYPITVTNTFAGSTNGSMAAVNLAVQPSFSSPPSQTASIAVGTGPTSVAINTATGFAVVTNHDSNNITLINLATQTAVSSLCTDGGACTTTGPASVAVDNIRNLALVANNANATLAVINLAGPTVTNLLTFPSADSSGNSLPLAPVAVGINPVSGRALVAFSTASGGSSAGAILDLTQSPPALINVVNLNNGPKPHIAVSPRLNWALATPGGAGALSIVDLGRQTTNQITSFGCSSGVVTVSTTATVGLFAGQPVLISGASPSSFNGIFSVASVSNTTFTFAKKSCASTGTGGTAAYALPVASVATPVNVRGVSINDETQKALLVDPNGNVPAFVFNILDQTSASVNALPSGTQNVATAMNPLTNIGMVVNQSGQVSVVDPVTPTVLSTFTTSTTGTPPPPVLDVDVAIDPITNTAVIVSQSDKTVKLFPLGGTLRSGAPQIIQSSFSPLGPAQSSSRVTINSNLGSAAIPVDQNVTLIGSFTTGSLPRLDGVDSSQSSSPFKTGSVSISANGRMLTATILGSFLAPNGPRQYALDVIDPSSRISNAAPLQVIQAVNLVAGCANPAPQGVAVATVVVSGLVHNVALVTEPGIPSQQCGNVAMVDLATGTGFGANPELAVGTNPQGIAVYPQAGLAVAANAASNNVSIVDIVTDGVPTTFTSDPVPSGAAIDPGTGKAVVTANGASLVDTFTVSKTAQTPTTIGVQQGPSGVAIDPKGHIAVVANSTSNTASVVDLNTNTTVLTSNGISFPQGVAFDPISGNFLITSGAANQVVILNPNTLSATPIRVGIDPSSIAYNFETGTLVTANNLSQTMTIVDFVDQTVRGVFSLKSSAQFAVDINPLTNLAVVADPADNQLLLVPLPH